MKIKPSIVIIVSLFLTCHTFGQLPIDLNQEIDSTAEVFIVQVFQLKEFQLERKRIDSMHKITGVEVKTDIEYNDNPLIPENPDGNTVLMYINENYGDSLMISLTILFDKKKNKIISVKNNRKSKLKYSTELKEFSF